MIRTVAMRPVALLLFLLALTGVLLADGAGLSAAVATVAAVATAAATAATCALLGARSAHAVPPTRVRTAIRDREQRTAFLPQRDPDASGRRRPRAPGLLVPTAVQGRVPSFR